MFSWTMKKNHIIPPGMCGLRFASDGVAFAHIIHQEKPFLNVCEFIQCGREHREGILSKLVKENHLQNSPCVWILAPVAYRLLSLEPLPVAPEEMLSAIRWHIRDKIDFPVAQASVDYFTLPHQGKSAKENLIYVVAAKKDYLARRADLIRASGLDLKCIDIPELTYRNIMGLYENKNGIALVGVRKGQAIFLIVRNNELYMLRRLDLKLAIMDEAAEEFSQRLCVEIQRSIDYYETELSEVPLGKLFVAPPYENFFPKLKANLSLTVEKLEISQGLLLHAPLSLEKQIRCPEAVGGALRVTMDAEGKENAPTN